MALAISQAQFSEYTSSLAQSFFSWQAELCQELIESRRNDEISYLDAKQTITRLQRRCFNCGMLYTLDQLFDPHSEPCTSHPVPLYWRHETVSWEGGGDSWDYKGFPCCGKEESSGCLRTVHMERLDALVDDVDWEKLYPTEESELPELVYKKSSWEDEQAKYLRSLKLTESERTIKQEQPRGDWDHTWGVDSSICASCHYETCLCDENDMFSFDELDLRQR